MSNPRTFPMLVMVAPNGQRDTIDRATVIEVVLAKDRAIRISIDAISDVNDVKVRITEVREGRLVVQPVYADSLTISSKTPY